MKKTIIVLLVTLLMGCRASKIPVCTTRSQTMVDTLPESKPWEIVAGTVLIGGMVILFYSDIEKNKDDK